MEIKVLVDVISWEVVGHKIIINFFGLNVGHKFSAKYFPTFKRSGRLSREI